MNKMVVDESRGNMISIISLLIVSPLGNQPWIYKPDC